MICTEKGICPEWDKTSEGAKVVRKELYDEVSKRDLIIERLEDELAECREFVSEYEKEIELSKADNNRLREDIRDREQAIVFLQAINDELKAGAK